MTAMDEVPLPFASRSGHVRSQTTFVAAAILAAHCASKRGEGFRPSDVRFFFLLFTNWIEQDVVQPGQDLDLTQVSRVLARLSGEGSVARVGETRRGAPRGARFALTPEGLFALARTLVDTRPFRPFDEVLFVVYFTASYQRAIVVRIEGDGLAATKRRRVAELLDPRLVIKASRRALARVLADVETRATEGGALSRAAHAARAEGASLDDIAARLERLSPYQMHRVRPFAELLTSLPEDLLAFELAEGIDLRVELIFEPVAERIRRELAILEQLDLRLAERAERAGHAHSPITTHPVRR
jgi:hypothetical protein